MKNDVTQLEIDSGFIARDKKLLPDTKDVQEYVGHAVQNLDSKDFVGVNYSDRVEWLEKNGYEVTRENLINPDLPTVPVEE